MTGGKQMFLIKRELLATEPTRVAMLNIVGAFGVSAADYHADTSKIRAATRPVPAPSFVAKVSDGALAANEAVLIAYVNSWC